MRDYNYTEDEIEEYLSEVLNLEQEEFEYEAEKEYWNSRCLEEFSDRILSGDWT